MSYFKAVSSQQIKLFSMYYFISNLESCFTNKNCGDKIEYERVGNFIVTKKSLFFSWINMDVLKN